MSTISPSPTRPRRSESQDGERLERRLAAPKPAVGPTSGKRFTGPLHGGRRPRRARGVGTRRRRARAPTRRSSPPPAATAEERSRSRRSAARDPGTPRRVGKRMKCVCTELVRGSSRPLPGGSCAAAHQPAEARDERGRHPATADELPVGARELHVVGHTTIVACRPTARLSRRGGSTHPFAVRRATRDASE